ncbi:MAG: hypothetical protein J3Q66DRAFT_175344 [Benniella sp.]|nr:MAG: hypothetical protein J3Q66DRAFT_175344 [Benniella sp.]
MQSVLFCPECCTKVWHSSPRHTSSSFSRAPLCSFTHGLFKQPALIPFAVVNVLKVCSCELGNWEHFLLVILVNVLVVTLSRRPFVPRRPFVSSSFVPSKTSTMVKPGLVSLRQKDKVQSALPFGLLTHTVLTYLPFLTFLLILTLSLLFFPVYIDVGWGRIKRKKWCCSATCPCCFRFPPVRPSCRPAEWLCDSSPCKGPLCLGHGVVLCAPAQQLPREQDQRLIAVHDKDEHHRDPQSTTDCLDPTQPWVLPLNRPTLPPSAVSPSAL